MLMKRKQGQNFRGVKLHHQTLRNCVFTFMDESKHYSPGSAPCPKCLQVHYWKTIHVDLDNEGNCVVSDEVYESWKAKGLVGELNAFTEAIPRPHVLVMPNIDARAVPLVPGEAPPKRALDIPGAPYVVSRETGVVRLGGVSVGNEVAPPADKFRREPDGSWTDLEKEKKHG